MTLDKKVFYPLDGLAEFAIPSDYARIYCTREFLRGDSGLRSLPSRPSPIILNHILPIDSLQPESTSSHSLKGKKPQ